MSLNTGLSDEDRKVVAEGCPAFWRTPTPSI